MNEALLGTSGKRDKRVSGANARSSMNSNLEEDEDRSPSKDHKGYKLVERETKTKHSIVLNKIRFIFILNLAPFLLIIYTFFDIHWYLMATTSINSYWTNLLFIEKDNQMNQTVYNIPMLAFIKNDCDYGNLTQNDPPQLCQVLQSYFYSGLIASVVIAFGLFLHILHMIQMARLGCKKSADLEGLRFHYFIIFCYVSSFIYWIFGSASFINTNSSGTPFLQKIGSSIIYYLSAILVFFLLSIWFEKLIKAATDQKMVHELLNAGNKYVSKL
jgi:hypothetical protein